MTGLFTTTPTDGGLGTSGATLSDDGFYRYVLWRRVGPGDRVLLFVMLNPSTADATDDDPTIRRCIGFARRDGFDVVRVVNLFAFRATDPGALYDALVFGPDIVGPENVTTVQREVVGADRVVCAWGANVGSNGVLDDYARPVLACLPRAVWCLGKTKSGAPRHPLYLPGDAPFVAWP